MDANVEKMLELIKKLPVDKITIIAEQCKSFTEISPRVEKILSLVDKLNDEEREQFFNIVKWKDGCMGMSGTSVSEDNESK